MHGVPGMQIDSIQVGGEWITVKPGTFRVDKYDATDSQGAVPDLEVGYSATCNDGVHGYGAPLDAITAYRYTP